jgi:hypothetical protein
VGRGSGCRHAFLLKTLRLIKQKAKIAENYSTIVAVNCTGFSPNERRGANTGTKAQDLQRAFDVFNQVSLELTQAYEGLQAV